MGASAIGTLNKVSYRYVLSVIDVSDGTLNWLHAVSEKKDIKVTSDELQNIC